MIVIKIKDIYISVIDKSKIKTHLANVAGRLGELIEFLFSDRICPEINDPKPDGNLAFSSSVFNGEDNISRNPSSVDEHELSDEKDENWRLLLGDSILFNLFGGNPHGSANLKKLLFLKWLIY